MADDNNDPFSEPGDVERTVIRPSPVRRTPDGRGGGGGGGGGGRRSTQPPMGARRDAAPPPSDGPSPFEDDAESPAPSRRGPQLGDGC